MVRARVRDLFDSYYPDYRGEESLFRRHIALALEDARVVVDAGCGSGTMADHDLRRPGRIVVGVDVDPAVARNPRITRAVRGSLDALPFRDGSVDVIVSRYVLEHLADPRGTFREVARVLKVDGRMVVLTPNSLHYVTLASRLSTTAVHRRLNPREGVHAEDVFPTHYRANSPSAIRRLARESGLEIRRLELIESSPNYLEFSRVLYRVGVFYERMVNRFPALARFRVNIVATLEKPSRLFGPPPTSSNRG